MQDKNLIKQILDKVLDRIITDYAPQKVILFGSYAYGTSDPDSDLDLLVVKETSDRFIDRLDKVQSILTGLHQGVPIQLIVLTPQEIESRLTRGDHFILDIIKKGELLYTTK